MAVEESLRRHAQRRRENARLRTAVFIAVGIYIALAVVANIFDWNPRIGMLIVTAIVITIVAQLLMWYERPFSDYWPFRKRRR